MNSKEASSSTAVAVGATASNTSVRTLANGKQQQPQPQKVFLTTERHTHQPTLTSHQPQGCVTETLPPPVVTSEAVSASSDSAFHMPIPPPPPQYDTSLHVTAEADLCRKLSCSGHTCNSQEDSLNSAYSEDEEEDIEEEEYYHLPKTNQPADCNSSSLGAIESHSCQTYEDHATQTEDEDSEAEEFHGLIATATSFHLQPGMVCIGLNSSLLRPH